MHFGADTARPRAGCDKAGPELALRKLLGQILGDGQRVPNGEICIDQYGHLTGWADFGDACLELRVRRKTIKAQHDLLEVNARLPHQHPGAHGPGGVVLVPDDKLEHGGSIWYRLQWSAPCFTFATTDLSPPTHPARLRYSNALSKRPRMYSPQLTSGYFAATPAAVTGTIGVS